MQCVPKPSAAVPKIVPGVNRQRGFNLIEAMVALVVISVGMIGIAALYGQGLSAGRTALYRTHAVNLASDMADRIRVNRLGGLEYAGAASNNSCDPQSGGAADCAPPDMAAHDLWVWQQQVEQLLPEGEGDVQFDGATLPPTYTIEVSWVEVGSANPLTHQVSIQVPNI